jgi:hypothetical protein
MLSIENELAKDIMEKKMKIKLFLNRYYTLFFLLFTVFISSNCSSNEPIKPEDKKSNIGIYLLTDQSITWENLQGRNLDSLKLTAWITSDMIDSVDYSSQVFYLNVNYNTLLAFPHNDNTPFVVVANDKRCYCGRFGPPKDTTQPCVTFTPMALCTDLVMLEFNPPQRKDIRFNDEVKSALSSLGKIKLGITYDLDGITFYNFYKPKLYRTGGLGVNNEKDWLYVKAHSYDIIKAGNKTYQTKLVFYNENSYYYLLPIIPPSDTLYHKVPYILDPEVGYNWAYFARFLSTDEDWTWSPSANTSHYFPKEMLSGTYYCYVEYYGGMMGGDKKMRFAPIGRIYMGYLRTNTIQVEYNSADTTMGSGQLKVLNYNVNLP